MPPPDLAVLTKVTSDFTTAKTPFFSLQHLTWQLLLILKTLYSDFSAIIPDYLSTSKNVSMFSSNHLHL